jgi:hypothetical protein
MLSHTTSKDIERCVMMWYNTSPEVARVVTEMMSSDDDRRRRREMMRLIGRPDGH